MSGGGGKHFFIFIFFFSEISEKCLIFTNFPQFAPTTRKSTTRESARTTRRATCQRHITREFGLKSKKNVWGEKKAKKLFLGVLR